MNPGRRAAPRAAIAAITAAFAAATASHAAAAAPDRSFAPDIAPLVDYAGRTSYPSVPHEEQYRAQLAALRHELRRTPPVADCAQSLGAERFAATLGALGDAESGLGRDEEALAAYRQALACRPRDLRHHISLAAGLRYAGRHEEAHAVVERGLEIEPEHEELRALRAQLDYASARWAQAAAALEQLARSVRDPEQASYWELLGWLARRHLGEPEPPLAAPAHDADWPAPLGRLLRGELDEAGLLARIADEPDELRRREKLAEALFYAGELRLLGGDEAGARRHFAAAVNLKVRHFVEHHLALAALARLRGEEKEF